MNNLNSTFGSTDKLRYEGVGVSMCVVMKPISYSLTKGVTVEDRRLCLLVLDAWEANGGWLTTCRVLSGHLQAELTVHFRMETVNRLPQLKE